MRVCVIIPAAGQSSRFGDSDKLSQDLGGRAMLVRTVELFAKREEVTSILVAGPPDRLAEFREKYGPTLGFHGGRIVEGGRAERWETVKKALEAVPDDATHIAVHDAARPGTSKDVLDRVFHAAAHYAAVIPVVPIHATVKRVSEFAEQVNEQEESALADAILGDEGKTHVAVRTVEQTVDRRGLVEVQTPQVFHAALLKRAYAQPNLAGMGATDDAAVVERLGETVHAVEGDVRNLKVTTPADLKLMRAILGLQPPAERPAHLRF